MSSSDDPSMPPPPMLCRIETTSAPPNQMDVEYPMSPPASPEDWLKTHWPVMTRCDVNYTMERYNFPSYVRDHIKNKWVKVNDGSGGTYEKALVFPSTEYMMSNGEDTVTVTGRVPLDSKQERLKNKYKGDGLILGNPMDDANAAAAAVMMTEGTQASVTHMFTREDGSTRSYAEMRGMYG